MLTTTGAPNGSLDWTGPPHSTLMELYAMRLWTSKDTWRLSECRKQQQPFLDSAQPLTYNVAAVNTQGQTESNTLVIIYSGIETGMCIYKHIYVYIACNHSIVYFTKIMAVIMELYAYIYISIVYCLLFTTIIIMIQYISTTHLMHHVWCTKSD